jgi:hypothetical protein
MKDDQPHLVGLSFDHSGGPDTVSPVFLRFIITVAVSIALTCRADDPPPAATIPLDAPVIVSTNDMLRILTNVTNFSCAASGKSVYLNHTVFMEPRGSLKARFDFVTAFSTEYELLSKLAECLAGTTVMVRKQPDGSYLYINASKEKSIIRVIHDECDSNHFEGVYFITVDRTFINVEALLHLETRPDRQGAIKYGAHIYADSDSRIMNLLSRIPFVKRILIREVNSVVTKFDVMYARMLNDPHENLRKVMELRDPKGVIYFSDHDIRLINRFLATHLRNQSTTAAP